MGDFTRPLIANVQFEKALPLLEELARADQQDLSINSSLINCYINLGRLEEALNSAYQAIHFTQPHGHTSMYVRISEINFLKGDKVLAIQNLQHALENVDKMEFPDVDDLLKKSRELNLPFTHELIRPWEIAKLKKEFGSEAPLKNKTIKDIQDLIEYVRTH